MVDFNQKIICITGLNGVGKTNILDAIHYLAFTKSALGVSDLQVIRHDHPYFLAAGNFNSKGEFQVRCYLEKNGKKSLKVGDVLQEKLSDHIGKVSVVLSSPYDHDIIHGTGEVRRKWTDGCISSHNPSYLDQLLEYKKILRQRNAFLKSREGRLSESDETLLGTYDDQLCAYSVVLSTFRKEFIQKFNPLFQQRIGELVGSKEQTSIVYETRVNDQFHSHFRSFRKKDIITCRTSEGIHRDEFVFNINGNPIKKFGSQGQQKSFLIALRLAQFDYLSEVTGDKPILLLDDVFDKLDDERITMISEILMNDKRIDQVILTDARKERTLTFFEGNAETQMIYLENGKVIENG